MMNSNQLYLIDYYIINNLMVREFRVIVIIQIFITMTILALGFTVSESFQDDSLITAIPLEIQSFQSYQDHPQKDSTSSNPKDNSKSTKKNDLLFEDQFPREGRQLAVAQVTTKYLTSLSTTNIGTRSIYFSSDCLSYFQMTWNTTQNATVIEVGKIDSNISGFIAKYTMDISDVWKVKAKSVGNIGCTMMYSVAQKMYIFILFDGTQVQLSASVLAADLPSELDPYKTAFLFNNTYLSPDCKVFSVNGNNYYLNSTLNPLSTPIEAYVNISMSTFGNNLYFFLNSTKTLYKYNFIKNLPKDQYLLPYVDSSYLGCQFVSYQNRFAISCQKDISNLTQIIIETTTFFICDNGTSFQLIDIIRMISNTTLTSVPIISSPMLTKVYRKFYDPTKSQTVFMLKHIDYSAYYIQDVLITNESDFYSIASSIVPSKSTFSLGDNYLVMRNDNLPLLMSIYNGYQFIGNSLIFIAQTSQISFNTTKTTYLKIKPKDANLTMASAYYSAGTNNYYETYFGQYQGPAPIQPNVTSQTPYLKLYVSPSDGYFITAKNRMATIMTSYNSASDQTQITYTALDKQASSKLSESAITLGGMQQFIKSSSQLECNAFYQSASQTITFVRVTNSFLSIYSSIILGNIPNIPSELLQYNNTATLLLDLNQYFIVASDCSKFYWYYIFDTGLLTQIFFSSLSNDMNQYTLSSDLKYIITDAIYQYSPSRSSYMVAYTLVDACSQPLSFFYQNRIIIACQNMYSTDQLELIINALVDYNDGEVYLLASFSLIVPIDFILRVSQKLTKIFIQYVDTNNLIGVSCYFYNVDFQNGYITPLSFQGNNFCESSLQFTDQTLDSKSFYMGDSFVVIRNDTSSSSSNNFYQQEYQFTDISVVLLSSNPIPESNAYISYKVLIDQDNKQSLDYFTFYENNQKGAGYNIELVSKSAQPFTITPSHFAIINESQADQQTFISEFGLTTFEIVYNPVSEQSNFRISILDRQSFNNLKRLQIATDGQWRTLQTQKAFLSCILVFNSNLQIYNFLKFFNGAFELFKSLGTTDIPPQILAMSQSQLMSKTIIGENCSFFATKNAVYNLNQPLFTPITTYAPFALSNFSSSMLYLVRDNAIYKFVPNNNGYVPIYNFQRFGMEFQFMNYWNRFICLYASAEMDGNNNYIIHVAVEVFVDNDGIIYYIDEFQVNIVNPEALVFEYSPKLTKFYLSYMGTGQIKPTMIIKNIDYGNYQAYDVNLVDLSAFLDTIPPKPRSIQSAEYTLSQNYLFIRNYSTHGGNKPSLIYAQQGFKFIGNNLVRTGQRILAASQIGVLYKTITDESNPNNLIIMDLYRKTHITKGFNVLQSNFGETFSSLSPIVTPSYSPFYLQLNSSRADSRFISSAQSLQSWEITYNPTTDLSVLSYSFINTSSSLHFKSKSIVLTGSWMTISTTSKNLTCVLAYSQIQQTFVFYNISKKSIINKKSFIAADLPTFISTDPIILSQTAKLGTSCGSIQIDNNVFPIGNYSLDTYFSVDYSSSDLQYTISNGQLMRYNPNDKNFSSLMVIPPWSAYKISNHQNRVIIIGKNISSTIKAGVTTVSLSYAFYVLLDNLMQAQMIDTFYLNIPTLVQDIPITISPNLTKIFYQYTIINTNTPISVIKTIDYNQLYLFDVDLTNWSSLLSNIGSTSTQFFKLSDRYLLIRNDTPSNMAAVNSDPTLQLYETAYEFIDTNMVFLASRLISLLQSGKVNRLFIDQDNSILTAYELQPKSRAYDGYFVYQYNYTAYNGILPLSSVLTSSIYTELSYSPTSKSFISVNSKSSIQVLQRIQNTTLIYTILQRNNQSKFSSYSYSFTEPWKIVNASLSFACTLFTINQRYVFLSFTNNSFNVLGPFNNIFINQSAINQYFISEDCSILNLNGILYSIKDTTLQPIISNTTFSSNIAHTNTYTYIIQETNVLRLIDNQLLFTPVFEGIPPNSACILSQYGITVAAICYSALYNSTYLNYEATFTFFMWLDLATLTLINYQTQTVIASNTNIFAAISPKLTKTMYSFFDENGSLTTNFLKLDFQLSTISHINFTDHSTLNQTAFILRNKYTNTNFVLSDSCMAIRNDSRTSVKDRNFVQQGYYFNQNNELVLLGTRRLAEGQFFNCLAITVDQSITNQMSLLVYYPKFRYNPGYRIYDIRYGSNLTSVATPASNSSASNATSITNSTGSNATNSSTQTINGLTISSNIQILPLPAISQSSIDTFQVSPLQNKFVGSTKMDNLMLNQANGSTFITIKHINRAYSANMTNSTTYFTGLWSFVATSRQTLSCLVVGNSPLTKYRFVSYSYESGLFSIFKDVPSFAVSSSFLSNMAVGENCNLVSSGNTVYNIANLTLVSPKLWNLMAQTSSLLYLIADYNLYAFDSVANSYTILTNMDHYDHYAILNYQSNLIIRGFNSTSTTNGYTIDERVWAMVQGLIFHTFDIKATKNLSPEITLIASPSLSKIFYYYINSDGQIKIGVKSIDFSYSTVTDLTFNDLPHFLDTVNTITNFDKAHYDIGQYYMVIRNDTTTTSSNSCEQAYQFVGNSIMLLRSRNLNTVEVGTSYRTVIDNYFINKLVVVDYYPSFSLGVLVGYNLKEFSYGNLASTIRTATHFIPPYITYTASTYTQLSAPQNRFQWTYVSQSISAYTTKFSFYTDTYGNLDNNVALQKFTFSGLWRIISETSKCKIIMNRGNSHYLMYQYDSSANMSYALGNLTNIMSNISVSVTNWKISNDCLTILIQNSILVQIKNATYSSIVLTKSWISASESLKYALDSNGVWKLDSIASNFTKLYASSLKGLDCTTKILQSGSALIIYSKTNLYSFAINGSKIVLILNMSIDSIISNPRFSISTNLRNIVVYGLSTLNSSNSEILGFNVDYNQFDYESIIIPTTYISNIQKTAILVEDNWLYVRQLNSSAYSNGNLEVIYGLEEDIIPIVSKVQNISDYDSANWKRTVLRQQLSGNLKAFTDIQQPNPLDIMVLQLQVTQAQAFEGSQPVDQVNTVVINETIKLCTRGCDDCSKGVCISCMQGFLYDSSTETCQACGYSCKDCEFNNPNICYSCLQGSYLSGDSCLPCDSTCLTCSGTPTSCHTCLSGYFYDTMLQQCNKCPRNCLSCNSTGLCIECYKGFAMINGKCRGCSISCSDCSPNNILVCTVCANGLQLVNQSCVSCPDQCSICKNGKCASCVSGYHPANDGSGQCVKNCQLPCATCLDRKPNVCTLCYYGSILNGTTCVVDLICHKYSNCTDCSQGSGLILLGATCVSCTSMPNCIQCSKTNSQLCTICSFGYYLKDNTCLVCPTSCFSCISKALCTSCQLGFTLVNSTKQSHCLQCTSPCLTCQNFQTYCTSCIENYTKIGWKCQSNINVGFMITLSTDVATALGLIDAIVDDLLRLLGMPLTQVQAITFSSFKAGSTVMSGLASVGGASSTITATSSMSSGLSGSTIAGIPVTSSNIVTNGVDISNQTTNNLHLALIIGLSIGIPFIIIVLIVLILLRSHSMKTVKPEPSITLDTKQKHQNSENIIVSSKLSQNQSNIQLKENQYQQEQKDIQEPKIRRGKFLIKGSRALNKIPQQRSQIEIIQLDRDIPQKQAINFQFAISDQSQISKIEIRENSSTSLLVSSFNLKSVLCICEKEIESYQTVFLQPSKKRKNPRVSQINESVQSKEGQPDEQLNEHQSKYASQHQQIIFDPYNQENQDQQAIEQDHSKKVEQKVQNQLPIQSESVSQFTSQCEIYDAKSK